jgi:hypothetical protein
MGVLIFYHKRGIHDVLFLCVFVIMQKYIYQAGQVDGVPSVFGVKKTFPLADLTGVMVAMGAMLFFGATNIM